MNVFNRYSLLLLGLLTSACTVSASRAVEVAAPGALVRRDVARGFDRYEAALAPWGTWRPDATYGVVWCPKPEVAGDHFRPYLSRGHWDFAAGSSPRWVSDDRNTWGEITTQHGWWVRGSVGHDESRALADQPAAGKRSYCWVPGADESSATSARVVWRTSDDFVAWAPATPDWLVADGDDAAEGDDDLEWVFTLVGALLDTALERDTLSGSARDAARAATTDGMTLRARRRAPGPSATAVVAARQKLVEWGLQNQKALAVATASISAETKAAGSSASAGSSSADGDSSSKKSSSSTTSVTIAGVRFEIVQLAPAMAYYDALLMGPPNMMGFLASRALVPTANDPTTGTGGGGASSLLAAAGPGDAGAGTTGSAAHFGGRTARSLLLAGAYPRGSEGASSGSVGVTHVPYSSGGSSWTPSSSHSSHARSSSSSSVSFSGGSLRVHR